MEELTSQLGQEFGLCFHRVFRRMRQALEPFGLTGPQFGILKTLKHRGPMTPSELSNHLLVTPGNITGLVRRLIRLKLIEQRRLVKDRRSSRVALTAIGEAKLEEILPFIKEESRKVFSIFQTQEKQTFLQLLQRLSAALKPEGSESPCCGGKE